MIALLGFSPTAKPHLPHSSQISRQAFEDRIEHEFIVGSAIDPGLFATSVDFIEDTGRWEVHQALGLEVHTQWQTRKPHHFGVLACLRNEEGSLWQGKPEFPIVNAKGKTQKYQTVAGNGSRAFLPAIPAEIRQRISDRYGVEVPLEGSFWDWVEHHPEVPIVFIEGGKKALSLLSLGYVAIALYGVNGGYSNVGGVRSLTPDAARLAVADRPIPQGLRRNIALAFDQDADQKTRKRVNVALCRFGGLLEQAGAKVSIAQWHGRDGKGVDDLIVNCGSNAFHTAYSEALRLNHWQLWQRLENRLTYPVAMRLNQADLSSLDIDRLPELGIIGIASAKGSGKTKLLAKAVAGRSALAAGHRIALMRNLCERLRLDYRGDLDKVNGRFTNGAAYTLRIGFCVDSLLAIDPSQFAGCDLVIDEVVQVLRHLLTSPTCNDQGMRPLLLARFIEIVRSARRVIVADADLDNATLHYLQQIRGDDSPASLIRNDYQAAGYAVRFIESPDKSAIVAELLQDIGNLPQGKVIFIAVDGNGVAIDRLIRSNFPDKRILLINSKTSGGKIEQAFIKNPDAEIENYDLILCSPSLGTGASIEKQGVIHRVYGIFSGGSIPDGDAAQALGRVRQPIDRIVWAAKRGSNFSKVSRSTNPIELKSHLQQQTSAAASLVKLSLRAETQSTLVDYDWASDAHLNLYCHFAAEQNRSMYSFRDALMVRLRHEGHQVTLERLGTDAATKLLLKSARLQVEELEARAIFEAVDLSYLEAELLERKESRSLDEELALAKFRLKDFYAVDEISIDEVVADGKGRRRGELLNLEAQLYPDVATDRTARSFEKQQGWNSGNCPWDINQSALRKWLRSELGLDDFLTLDRPSWTKYDLKPYADRVRRLAAEIKIALHLTINDSMSDVQIIHQLLSQLGLKVAGVWSRKVAGHEGEKLRVYSLNAESWEESIAILHRRKTRRDRLQSNLEDTGIAGSPPPKFSNKKGGDPRAISPPHIDEWGTADSLADVRSMWESADSDQAREELQRMFPDRVLRLAIHSQT